MRGIQQPAQERFWEKVNKTDTCWLWTAAKRRYGYGSFGVATGVWSAAHRFAYEDLVGPIPEGLTLDHLCSGFTHDGWRHLEPVTNDENSRRAAAARRAEDQAETHCPAGHLWSEFAVFERGRFQTRRCKACRNERRRGRPRAARKIGTAA